MHTVIYHNNCYDGMGAAWVMAKYLTEVGKINEPVTYFVPCNYSDEPPWDKIDGANVYIVDFSWPLDKMVKIIKRAKHTIILDHHKTAEIALSGLSVQSSIHPSVYTVVFDNNRSGAGIAWDYFFGPAERPDLVAYVEDRDLWRYALPNSRELNAFIQSFDIDLPTWINEFGYHGNLSSTDFKAGESLLRLQSKLVKSICEHASICALPWVDSNDGQSVTINREGVAVVTSILFSEVCEQMLNDHPEAKFAWYTFYRKDGKNQYGLRSRTGSDIDVSIIAKRYGGGGHKHAAGFEL